MNDTKDIQNVPKRILSSLLSSVAAGVVPRAGSPYIAIGRQDEIAALLSDLENINEGGGALRFLIGRYGSGKSFLIQLIRGYALERGFVTADADLSPERRLYGTGGSGVATYKELIKNLAR
jgi:ABC-type polysaccharide/polyol phosphate transport system ATPase subunit